MHLFFPPIPQWEGMHVLIVHLPIALLLVSPLFVLLGMLPGRQRTGTRVAALVLLILGTGAAYMAIESGEAAAQLADRSGQVAAVLEQHAAMAEWVRDVFTGITVLYGLFVVAGLFVTQLSKPAIATSVQVVVLLAMGVGVLMVADTGDLGGRLVHEFGLRAAL